MPEETEYNQITELISLGKFKEALKKINPILKAEPENVGLLLDAGYINANLGDFDTAIAMYQKTIEFVPESASGYTGLGFVYKMQNDHEKALEQFQRGIDISPDNALIHFEIGETLLDMDRFEEALKSYYKAIQFGGLETEVETLLRIAQVHLGLNDPDKSLEVARNVLSKDPTFTSIYYIMAGAETLKENWSEAQAYLNKYLENYPDDDDAKEMLKHIEENL